MVRATPNLCPICGSKRIYATGVFANPGEFLKTWEEWICLQCRSVEIIKEYLMTKLPGASIENHHRYKRT